MRIYTVLSVLPFVCASLACAVQIAVVRLASPGDFRLIFFCYRMQLLHQSRRPARQQGKQSLREWIERAAVADRQLVAADAGRPYLLHERLHQREAGLTDGLVDTVQARPDLRPYQLLRAQRFSAASTRGAFCPARSCIV